MKNSKNKRNWISMAMLLSVVAAISISCSSIYDNVEKYANSEIIYADKLDGIERIQIGYERVEIDLLKAGRIPASKIKTGKATKTVIECEDFTETGNRRVIDSICSWVNITGLTQLKDYIFTIYTEDDHGNRSIPLTAQARPYTAENRDALELVSPSIIESTSAVLLEWKEPISAHTHTVYRHAYSYTDRSGAVHTGNANGDVPSFLVENIERGKDISITLTSRTIPTTSNFDGTYTPILDTIDWQTTVRVRISENAEAAIFLKTPAPAFDFHNEDIDFVFPITFSWVTVPEASGYNLKISSSPNFPEGVATYTVNAGNTGDYLMDIEEGRTLIFDIFRGWRRLYWTVTPTAQSAPVKSQTRNFNIDVFKKEKFASWLFEDPDDLTKATIGKSLTLVTRNDGTITLIEGPNPSKKAIRIPALTYFLVDHGMYPIDGLSYITDYTIFFWAKIPTFTVGQYYPFFRTAIINNATSEECQVAWRSGVAELELGVGVTGYQGLGMWKVNQWHRFYATFSTGNIRWYVDGEQALYSNSADVRFRMLLEGCQFFTRTTTNTALHTEFHIAEIAMWNRVLTEEDIEELENEFHRQ